MKRESLVTLPRGLIVSGREPDRSEGALGYRGERWQPMALDPRKIRSCTLCDGRRRWRHQDACGGAGRAEQTLHLGHGGSSNPDAVGAHAATDSLVRATDEAIGRAGIEREQLDAAVLAIAGTDTERLPYMCASTSSRMDRGQRRGRRLGRQRPTPAPELGRSRAPVATCSVWAGRAGMARRRLGTCARRRGQRLLAGGAVDQGRACRPRGLRPARQH